MDNEIWEKAVAFHGHSCPGLAMGVRAAVEAKRILGIEDIQDKTLYCVIENMACYADGIQVIMGCTVGKGNLIYRPTGKTAFSFFHGDDALRLVYKDSDAEMTREERRLFILNAPVEEVYTIGKPDFTLPEKKPRQPSVKCSVCGESAAEDKMRLRDGKPVCLNCAGEI